MEHYTKYPYRTNPHRKLASLSSNPSPSKENSSLQPRKQIFPSLKPSANSPKQARRSTLTLQNPQIMSKIPPNRQKTSTDSKLSSQLIPISRKASQRFHSTSVDANGVEQFLASDESFSEDLCEKEQSAINTVADARGKKVCKKTAARFFPGNQLRPQIKKPQIQQVLDTFGKDLNKLLEGKIKQRKEVFDRHGYGKIEAMGGSWEDHYENPDWEIEEYSPRKFHYSLS